MCRESIPYCSTLTNGDRFKTTMNMLKALIRRVKWTDEGYNINTVYIAIEAF